MLTSTRVNGEIPWTSGVRVPKTYTSTTRRNKNVDYSTVIHDNYLFHTVPRDPAFGIHSVFQSVILLAMDVVLS